MQKAYKHYFCLFFFWSLASGTYGACLQPVLYKKIQKEKGKVSCGWWHVCKHRQDLYIWDGRFGLSEALHYIVIRGIYLQGINIKFSFEVAHTFVCCFFFFSYHLTLAESSFSKTKPLRVNTKLSQVTSGVGIDLKQVQSLFQKSCF